MANIVEAHAPVHKISLPRGANNAWILAPRRPSDKDNGLHTHAHTASPRLARTHDTHDTHGTHETKTKTKRSRSPGYGGSDKPD